MWPFSRTNNFSITNCLFGAVKLTKNAVPDEFLYSGYVIGFDVRSTFSVSDGNGFGKNVIIFRVHNSSPAHVEIKNRS